MKIMGSIIVCSGLRMSDDAFQNFVLVRSFFVRVV